MSFSVDVSLKGKVLNIMVIKFAEKLIVNSKFEKMKTSFDTFLLAGNDKGMLSFDDFRKLFTNEILTDGEIHQFCVNNNYEVIF